MVRAEPRSGRRAACRGRTSRGRRRRISTSAARGHRWRRSHRWPVILRVRRVLVPQVRCRNVWVLSEARSSTSRSWVVRAARRVWRRRRTAVVIVMPGSSIIFVSCLLVSDIGHPHAFNFKTHFCGPARVPCFVAVLRWRHGLLKLGPLKPGPVNKLYRARLTYHGNGIVRSFPSISYRPLPSPSFSDTA